MLPSLHASSVRRAGRSVLSEARALLWAAAWVGGALVAAGPAWAVNTDVRVDVTAVPTTVSVSRSGLATYAAYEIVIRNRSTNVLNQVVFSGRSSVVQAVGSPPQAAPYVESNPASACVPDSAPGSIVCSVGQLRGAADPSGSFARFVVLFAAPPSGEKIDFHSSITYSMSASPNAPPSKAEIHDPDVFTTLVTTASGEINSGFRTYIPSFGGTFFTGANKTALSTDPATTVLTVPEKLGLETVEVSEKASPGGLSSDTLTTNIRTITVPAASLFAEPVTIELRRDSSTIRTDRIDRAVVQYAHDDVLFNPLPNCPVGGPTREPGGVPVCIMSRTSFTKKTAPTPGDSGDWLFIIKALENGSFKD